MVYQAITTKYLSPTNTKGARIRATSASGISKTVAYDHALDAEGNHLAAARYLVAYLNWPGKWVQGSMGERGYVFVHVSAHAPAEGFTHTDTGFAKEPATRVR